EFDRLYRWRSSNVPRVKTSRRSTLPYIQPRPEVKRESRTISPAHEPGPARRIAPDSEDRNRGGKRSRLDSPFSGVVRSPGPPSPDTSPNSSPPPLGEPDEADTSYSPQAKKVFHNDCQLDGNDERLGLWVMP
ncbi:hypothetical protein GP486_008816, partial [Trichoglossum hirsutum]